ncbi:hypothetical protein [Planomicrobium sp. CPCC 101079]|uniref:hypothetical protein n=1 Tax=Planomicrobium sp. CPCC 101079 TaxID=2599618 RepID=UPI0011B39A7D|nr:hypothetical protein [Planomicrobium sp. CPCC 101079]TWT01522.1 hypothetical protein FQV28_15730 [Planomicrobium sp. CPCC 101079]
MIPTYQGPKYDGFWRTAFVILLLAGALIGVALVAAPIYFYMKFRIAWLLIFFIFIPFGDWIARSALRYRNGLKRTANHRFNGWFRSKLYRRSLLLPISLGKASGRMGLAKKSCSGGLPGTEAALAIGICLSSFA